MKTANRWVLPVAWGALLTWLAWCAVQSYANGAPVYAAVFVAGSALTVTGALQGFAIEDAQDDLARAREETAAAQGAAAAAQARADAWEAAAAQCPIACEITLGWAALYATCCLTAWHTHDLQHDTTCCRTTPTTDDTDTESSTP